MQEKLENEEDTKKILLIILDNSNYWNHVGACLLYCTDTTDALCDFDL